MSWSSLTLTRELLDSMESETLENYNSTVSVLGITDKDDERVELSKRKLSIDILNIAQKSVFSGDFTEDTLLDAVVAVDSQDLLQDLLAYYFLSLLFQDASINRTGRGMEKHKYYYMLYMQNLKNTITILLGKVTPPQQVRRLRMVHTFG